MKKYKLKRWYPSLDVTLSVGDIIELTGRFKSFIGGGKYEFIHKTGDYSDVGFIKKCELNNPDFWELIEEKPKPLFITEDGVECFDRDEYIAIGNDFRKINALAYNCDAPYSSDVMRFVFESNADEYIWRNKPLFSYEDFICWGNVPYQRVIEQLAKERI